jgi:hypothetical protein
MAAVIISLVSDTNENGQLVSDTNDFRGSLD